MFIEPPKHHRKREEALFSTVTSQNCMMYLRKQESSVTHHCATPRISGGSEGGREGDLPRVLVSKGRERHLPRIQATLHKIFRRRKGAAGGQ